MHIYMYIYMYLYMYYIYIYTRSYPLFPRLFFVAHCNKLKHTVTFI